MPDRLGEGIKFFNAGSYFEAHEVWEEMWHQTNTPLRGFYQGLIHAAVGLHHLARNNRVGAQAQIEKSLKKLENYSPECCGIDVAGLQKSLRQILDAESGSEARSVRISRNFR